MLRSTQNRETQAGLRHGQSRREEGQTLSRGCPLPVTSCEQAENSDFTLDLPEGHGVPFMMPRVWGGAGRGKAAHPVATGNQREKKEREELKVPFFHQAPLPKGSRTSRECHQLVMSPVGGGRPIEAPVHVGLWGTFKIQTVMFSNYMSLNHVLFGG